VSCAGPTRRLPAWDPRAVGHPGPTRISGALGPAFLGVLTLTASFRLPHSPWCEVLADGPIRWLAPAVRNSPIDSRWRHSDLRTGHTRPLVPAFHVLRICDILLPE
jgi:hypothetical protein